MQFSHLQRDCATVRMTDEMNASRFAQNRLDQCNFVGQHQRAALGPCRPHAVAVQIERVDVEAWLEQTGECGPLPCRAPARVQQHDG